jgi:hypothetical protein
MQAIRVRWSGGVNPSPGAWFERADGSRVGPDWTRLDTSGALIHGFFESLRPYESIRVGSLRHHTVSTNTGPPVQLNTPTEQLVYVRLDHVWPYEVGWGELQGFRLDDGDAIVATIEYDVAPDNVVEFFITSTLWWWKEINVPDGETGSSWTIHTGAEWWGGRRFVDSTALWAHQVHNGQWLTFRKAKTFGLVSSTYLLGGLNILPPRSRVTFNWIAD